MKDKEAIFQPPFIAEGGKKFSAERFSVLSRTIFRSQSNDLSFAAERNEALLKDVWNIFQLVTTR